MSCSASTPGATTKLNHSTSASGTGAISTLLPNVSSSKPAKTANKTAAASATAISGVDLGNQTTGDANSTSNRTEGDKSSPAKGDGANGASLSYFAFLLTVVGAFVMEVIEV